MNPGFGRGPGFLQIRRPEAGKAEKRVRPTPRSPLRIPNTGKFTAAILSGLSANIAVKKDKNIYRAARGREAMIFPGSALFDSAGSWIVAAEMVETSRLFARAVATIDPGWLEKLAGHAVPGGVHGPALGACVAARSTATEQVTLFGLVIIPGRTVAYGRIRPG